SVEAPDETAFGLADPDRPGARPDPDGGGGRGGVRRGLRPRPGPRHRPAAAHPRHRGLLLLPLPVPAAHRAVRPGGGADQAVVRTLRTDPAADRNPDPPRPAHLRPQSEALP